MPLFQIGLLQIDVVPFNFERFTHKVGADFAAKDVIGAQKPREFVGAADDTLDFHGKLFPARLGGLDELDIAIQMAQSGDPQMVVRGDGLVYGWYLVQEAQADHETLDARGVGREITVDMKLVKSPNGASAQAMMSTILGLF